MTLDALAIDPATGLPPDERALQQQRLRLERIRDAAQEARLLVEEARRRTTFDFDVPLPERALKMVGEPLARLEWLAEYRRCVDAVSAAIARSDWDAAVSHLQAFVAGQSQVPEGVHRLGSALKTGQESFVALHEDCPPLERLRRLASTDLTHPLLAPLRQQAEQLAEAALPPLLRRHAALVRAAEKLCRLGSNRPRVWLTTPALDRRALLKGLEAALATVGGVDPGDALQLDEAINDLLEVAGPNKAALLALAGDVEGVKEELKHHKDRLPHNLAVATFVRLEQREKAGRDDLSLALSCAALFACCEPYRRRVNDGPDPAPPEAGRTPQDQVRAGLESLFRQVWQSWGGSTDPQSLCSLWAAECLAVTRLQAGGYQRLGWPFGPALIRFYGLEQELQVVLQTGSHRIPPRPCYGPCAVAEVLILADDHDAALRTLPEPADCTEEMARTAPGYVALPDALAALRQDVTAARGEAWLGVLRRQPFPLDTPSVQVEAFCHNLTAACRALLSLQEQAGGTLAGRFRGTLLRLFDDMKKQIERLPNSRRRVTVEDGKARRRCMDAVIDCLEQAPRQPWLDDCLRLLQARRAELLLHVVFILFRWWSKHDKSLAIVLEMLELAEQAVRDAPNDHHAHVVRAQMLTLKATPKPEGDPEREALIVHLRALQSQAAGLDWPPESSRMINSLLEMAEKPDDPADWMAAMLPSKYEEGGEP